MGGGKWKALTWAAAASASASAKALLIRIV